MAIEFRTLGAGDASSVHAIMSVCRDLGSPIWSATQIEASLAANESLGAFSGDQLVAFILLQRGGGVCEILHLATSPAFRRQGVMRKLLGHGISLLKPESEIWLEVHEDNQAARQLYEEIGFKEVGRRPSYYSDGAPAVLYNLG